MLSQKAKYAIKALLELARLQKTGSLAQARELAASQNIPKKFLDLIFFELRRDEVPVVQQLLHLVGDAGRIMGGAQVTGHHHQLSVAGAVLVGRKLHGLSIPLGARRIPPGESGYVLVNSFN